MWRGAEDQARQAMGLCPEKTMYLTEVHAHLRQRSQNMAILRFCT